MSNQAGKGDKPRSCFSKRFKDNYDEINWDKPKNPVRRQRIKFEEYNDEKWYEINQPLSEWQEASPDLSEDYQSADERWDKEHGRYHD